jgi:hypothetical protein
MSGFKLQRLGMLMEPELGNPQEIEGVLNPAATRGLDGELYLFPRLTARGNYSRIGIVRVRFNEAGDPAGVEQLGIATACLKFPRMRAFECPLQRRAAGWRQSRSSCRLGSSFVDAGWVVKGVNAQGDSRTCAGKTDEKRSPVSKPRPFSAASGKLGRAD